jgi:hypothetical protein
VHNSGLVYSGIEVAAGRRCRIRGGGAKRHKIWLPRDFHRPLCEDLLIRHGRSDEAYLRYGLRAVSGTTNLSIYRSLVRAYPDRDQRQMLLDLIETHGDKGKCGPFYAGSLFEYRGRSVQRARARRSNGGWRPPVQAEGLDVGPTDRLSEGLRAGSRRLADGPAQDDQFRSFWFGTPQLWLLLWNRISERLRYPGHHYGVPNPRYIQKGKRSWH